MIFKVAGSSTSPYMTTLQRAFELAESGNYESVRRIQQRLKQEGYDQGQVAGRSLTKQLGQIIQKARAGRT